MKTDKELVAKGIHPIDVAWLEDSLEKAENTIKRVKVALKETS